MITIKVSYKHESRRLALTSNSTWKQFESQLRTLFKIPDALRFIISYLDEDGDNITLSSDIELMEVFYQSSAGIPIKMVLTIPPKDVEEAATAMEQLKIEDINYDGGNRVHLANPESENIETENETEQDSFVDFEDFYVPAEEEVDQSNSDPEIYFVIANSRGTRRRPKFGYVKFNSSEDFNGYPFMRGELLSHHKGSFDNDREVHSSIPKGPELNDFDRFDPPFPGRFHGHEFDHREKYVKESDPHGRHKNGHGHDHGRHGHGHHVHHAHSPDGHSHRVHVHGHRARGHGRKHGKHGHGHHVHGHDHNKHGKHGHGHKHDKRSLTPEELAEKVELLNQMGLPSENNAYYEELLIRFDGIIENVVGMFLWEGKHKREENGKDKEPENDEDSKCDTSVISEILEVR